MGLIRTQPEVTARTLSAALSAEEERHSEVLTGISDGVAARHEVVADRLAALEAEDRQLHLLRDALGE